MVGTLRSYAFDGTYDESGHRTSGTLRRTINFDGYTDGASDNDCNMTRWRENAEMTLDVGTGQTTAQILYAAPGGQTTCDADTGKAE